MKKIATLLIAISLLGISPATFATTKSNLESGSYGYYSNYENSFTFVEGGITFSVFQNGEFDFYINPGRGLHVDANYSDVSISYNSGYDYDAYVQYDNYGAIIQIEDVPIYYDYYGRITRAGFVDISYHSNRLIRIGGMHVFYKHHGYYSHYSGYINRYNRHYVYSAYHDYFVRPFYTDCIVSYNPYRRHYRPERIRYYDYKRHYSRSHNSNRHFKSINSRIASAKPSKKYANRSTYSRSEARRNPSVRRKAIATRRSNHTVRSTDVRRRTVDRSEGVQRRGNIRSNDIKRRGAERNIDTKRSNVSSGRNVDVRKRTNLDNGQPPRRTPRIDRKREAIRKSPARTTERRTVERRNSSKSVEYNRPTPQRSTPRMRPQTRKAPERRPAVQSRSNGSNRNKTVRKQSSSTPQTEASKRSSTSRRGR